jgi:hypothetical protein
MRLLAFANILSLTRGTLPNTKKKLCRDCRHFIANNEKCSIFGDVNMVTGKENYDYATTARFDNEKCGDTANKFEENHYKIITVPYYFLKEYWMLSPVIGLSAFYIFSLMKLIHHN